MLVGIDVAKAELVVGTRPTAERWTVGNDERGVRTLVERLTCDAPELIVLEATGGYELLAVAALVAAGLPVVVVNPRQVRDFARATGQLAKSDRIDADVLALFGERVRPEVRPLRDDAAHELDALLAGAASCSTCFSRRRKAGPGVRPRACAREEEPQGAPQLSRARAEDGGPRLGHDGSREPGMA